MPGVVVFGFAWLDVDSETPHTGCRVCTAPRAWALEPLPAIPSMGSLKMCLGPQGSSFGRWILRERGRIGSLFPRLVELLPHEDAYQKVRGLQDEAAKKAGMDKWFAEDRSAQN